MAACAVFGVVPLSLMLALFACTVLAAEDEWRPTSWEQCRTNTDCKSQGLCCSITPALGRKRQFPVGWDGMVHYCLPWKDVNATWCELRMQYSPDQPNYRGLCPCGPGLRCTPTDQLDPHSYPRDRFGKCTSV